MSSRPVEAVWVWRYGTTPFKAVYGRFPGDGGYTKDFLQASGECAKAVDEVFRRPLGTVVDIKWTWPNGQRDGRIHEAADYPANGRLDLRWDFNNAPTPWKLSPATDASPLKTFIGDPTKTTIAGADAELAKFLATDVDPWLVVVKLRDESDRLHVRAYLGKPPAGLEHTSTAQLPATVRTAMTTLTSKKGCAVTLPAPGSNARAPKVVADILDALKRGPNVLLVGPPGTGKTVALEDLRAMFEGGSSEVVFDPDKTHDAWTPGLTVPTGKVRTIVFHPSYSYEEFVIGLYPTPAAGGAGVDLVPRPGPLLSLGHWASEGAHALLIVDEFNRGNAAAIFGDTLALLDKDKRRDAASGAAGATIDRPYPELPVDVTSEFAVGGKTSLSEQIHLPSTLWIVAAMNSSDRSVAPLDAALRRRFSIVRVDPDYEVLAAQLGVAAAPVVPAAEDLDSWTPDDVLGLAVALLRNLNERIEMVLGADFLLGHALLWGVDGADTASAVKSLRAAWDERITSTLRMTFADQDEPLAAILGAGPPPSSGAGGSALAQWLAPLPGLEAVAPPRLRVARLQDLPWEDAAVALRSLV